MEYPIIDGMPVLVPDVRAYLVRFVDQLIIRDDLPAGIESLLGDALGPGTSFDSNRQTLSSYVWDHYGDLDPAEVPESAEPGAVQACVGNGLAMLAPPPEGLCLDLGCGPGRSTFALAAVRPGLTLGVDLNPASLRVAHTILRDKRVCYARRRVGLVYDRREFAVSLGGAERTDFWIADASELPFADATCGLAVGINLLDCLGAPVSGLATIGRVLADGGGAILSTPYDWSGAATPPENWIGGHSQRASHGGSAEPLLRRLLASDGNAASGLELQDETPRQPWSIRLHERAVMHYHAHLVVARRRTRS